MKHLLPTDGGRDLARYLRDKRLSISEFCRLRYLDRIQVQRAIKGEQRRFSVDFAWAIERATEGRVKMHRWASDTARSSDARAA